MNCYLGYETRHFFLGGIVVKDLNGLLHSHDGASRFMVARPVADYARQHPVLQAPSCVYSRP